VDARVTKSLGCIGNVGEGNMSDNKQAPLWFRGIFYVVFIAIISWAIF